MKRPCVHPAALQLFQKLAEFKPGFVEEGGAKAGEAQDARGRPAVSGGVASTATRRGGEGRLAELRSGLDPEKLF